MQSFARRLPRPDWFEEPEKYLSEHLEPIPLAHPFLARSLSQALRFWPGNEQSFDGLLTPSLELGEHPNHKEEVSNGIILPQVQSQQKDWAGGARTPSSLPKVSKQAATRLRGRSARARSSGFRLPTIWLSL